MTSRSRDVGRRASRPPGAFTLLEVLAVLAIVAVAAGIAFPRLAMLGDLHVEAAAGRLAERLTEARERAILGGRPAHVVVAKLLPAGIGVEAIVRAGTSLDPRAPLVLGADGDALPRDIRLVDARGNRARVVVPPGMRRAHVAPGGDP